MLRLMCGIRLLSDSSLFGQYSERADQLLREFIKIMETESRFFPTMAVHQIIHLGQDVRYHNKPLESFACYKFENTLKTLKSRITNYKDPLKNLTNRLRVQSSFESNTFSRRSRGVKKMIDDYDLVGLFEDGMYRCIQSPRFYLKGVGYDQREISDDTADCYFITKQYNIYLLRSISCRDGKNITLEASSVKFRDAFQFYNSSGQVSFSSSECGIYVLRTLRPTLSSIPVTDVHRKLIVHSMNGINYGYTLIA